MFLEEALVPKLKDVLAGVVGGRVFADYSYSARKDDYPLVVYQRAADDNPVSLDGVRSNIRAETYTLELWTRDRADGWKFREACFAAFAGANCKGRWGGDQGVWVCGAVASAAAADALRTEDGKKTLDLVEALSLRVVWNAAK